MQKSLDIETQLKLATGSLKDVLRMQKPVFIEHQHVLAMFHLIPTKTTRGSFYQSHFTDKETELGLLMTQYALQRTAFLPVGNSFHGKGFPTMLSHCSCGEKLENTFFLFPDTNLTLPDWGPKVFQVIVLRNGSSGSPFSIKEERNYVLYILMYSTTLSIGIFLVPMSTLH